MNVCHNANNVLFRKFLVLEHRGGENKKYNHGLITYCLENVLNELFLVFGTFL